MEKYFHYLLPQETVAKGSRITTIRNLTFAIALKNLKFMTGENLWELVVDFLLIAVVNM